MNVTKIEVITTMAETGLVPVFCHKEYDVASKVLKACYDGGVRLFEFTNREDFSHEVFAKLVKYSLGECPQMILGAGSIVDAPTAALFIENGAKFIVGPLFNPDIAKLCNRRLIPYIPGCSTVTEIGNAQEAGCDICKLFPAGNLGGPSFIRSILAPMPWSRLMVTGGVNLSYENIQEWIKSGVTTLGIGSNLFPVDEIESGIFDSVTENCRRVLTIIEECRTNKRKDGTI